MSRGPVDRMRARAKHIAFLMSLTCVFVGQQGVFTAILPLGNPYMLSLGITKPVMAILWIAAPAIGALASPYFGFISDNSKRPLGKRRPYIIMGSVGMVTSLFGLAWIREAGALVGLEGQARTLHPLTLFVAVLLLWSAVFFMQPALAALRALIVDVCPPEQQGEANAWASMSIGLGNILGYVLASIDMSMWFNEETNGQYKAVTALVSAVMVITVIVCCIHIREEDPSLAVQKEGNMSFWAQTVEIYRGASRLSPEIKSIFRVQLFAWFGFYCFLFYVATWIGELCESSFC